jgi:hypothetical protein
MTLEVPAEIFNWLTSVLNLLRTKHLVLHLPHFTNVKSANACINIMTNYCAICIEFSQGKNAVIKIYRATHVSIPVYLQTVMPHSLICYSLFVLNYVFLLISHVQFKLFNC